MARKLKTIVAWINTNTRLRAEVEPTHVRTDRPKPRGLRYRVHTGKGRDGFMIRVWDGNAEIFKHNGAERYRSNDEVESWLAKWLKENA